MGDACKKITIVVDIQENGIIRMETGYIIGRIDRDMGMERIATELEKASLRILYNSEPGTKL